MQEILHISIGASIGANLRNFIVHIFKAISLNYSFPIGILFANCLGCLLAGFFLHLNSTKAVPQFYTPLISIGFFGALTTFSTFAVDSIKLLRVSFSSGLLNIFSNLCICLLLIWVGEFLCKKIYS
ncbi:MAG: fluoride efflux transporter CrcB [Candidatus Cloacimonadota bacterium]|nr:MAG: fluoride efflux transporter CrcB [Candidatus Cloacimonadota bacterium]